MLNTAVPTGLKVAWYGDDFTGASDTLATYAEAGLKTRLFLDVPTAEQLQSAGPLDAIGIAGAARSMSPSEMRRALEPVAQFFSSCGAPVLHYKCCSTFDSAPHVGSIGEAVRTLNAAIGDRPAIIVGGQPGLGRYCAFGQLFAESAAHGPVHRIDRHPTMSRHPVTPMAEADLRSHLAQQGLAPVALLDLRAYDRAIGDLDTLLDTLAPTTLGGANQAVLMDAVRDSHLEAIGRLIWQRSQKSVQLCVGSSSVAQALLDSWEVPRRAHSGSIAPATGPVLVLAGSMSPLSARQISSARRYQRIALDESRLVANDVRYVDDITQKITLALREGRNVLVHTSPLTGHCSDTTRSGAMDGLASASGQLLRRVLTHTPVMRLGVAGGDTSSHALQALAPDALEWIGRPAPGVALCRIHAKPIWLDGMEVMLKGGQMGGDDLLDELVIGTI
jgi:uncharacterized protein YgbK (DUF1537 family)